MLLNMLDGYDIFIMGFALPLLPDGFATTAEKGYLISAALAGMGVGATLLARLADIVGRRRTILLGLILNIVGLGVSALAPSFAVLLGARFVTGVAIGTIGVVIMVLGKEIAPRSKGNLAIGIVMIGYPIGSMVAGASGAAIISVADGSWRGLFWIGAALTVAAFTLSVFFMPESVKYLTRVGTAESIAKADAISARMDNDAVDDDASPAADDLPDSGQKVYLLGAELRKRTLLLWGGYSIVTASYYFVGSWTPQLITNVSGDVGSGALAGILVSIGTVLGALLFGVLSLRHPVTRIGWTMLTVALVSLVAFSLLLQAAFTLALIMAAVLGAALYGVAGVFTALSTSMYPVLARAKGYGSMLGVARVGTIVSPIAVGYALAVVSTENMYLSLLVPVAVAIVVVFALQRIVRADELTATTASVPNDGAADDSARTA
ncbi:hypothetical protein CH296_26545 [Rhodococcus sp. 14-2496-1d]|nr:hypothetical protein CH296_26545 [Rhodococcus sp. 14-2496-1d]